MPLNAYNKDYKPMVPLTVRSHFSLMWGTVSIRRLCRAARHLGYTRLALTDTDNLYGLWLFLAACRNEGLTPIVGAEVTDPQKPGRAVCLVADDEGYANLCRLLTRRHMDTAFALETTLPPLSKGLKVLTGDRQLLSAWHAAGVSVAAALPRRPKPFSHRLCLTAKHLGVPLVATPGSFFLEPREIAVHHLLRAIAHNTCLSRLDPNACAPPDAWLAGPQEYERRFAICPEAVRATHELAEALPFTGPHFGLVMPPWGADDNGGADHCLRQAAYAGARGRYGDDLPEPVVERLEQELAIIRKMGFSAYFLVVEEIVRRSPRTCGRGSGAASLVAYCLKITNVCPIKHNLYFSRFLNPGRSDPPDIDVDFAWDERDAVIETVLAQHRGHAAMVCSQVLFQPRMAVREVAKVFGLTDAEIGKVSSRLPWYWRQDAPEADLLATLKQRPESKALDFIQPWPQILHSAQRLIGIPRYLSVHPGGVVVTPRPIEEYVPVMRAAKGVPVIQWEKDAAEEAGLTKIDLLGNRSLAVIRDALGNLHENALTFDESHWEPEDDFATQEALAQGRTMGCFYIESPAMRLLQQKAGVGDFEHLVIHSSIIRPAANDFIQEYLRRLHGGAFTPIHPLLSDVLKETFGIMVYQEDVSRAAVALAGFSHADADGLRKVMSKKDKQYRLADYHQRFLAGAEARGVSKEQIDAVWAMMMSFDGYSFCKPHSASYARVSFQAAYLKVHYPAEFMAGVISNQGGFYSTFAYVEEARRMGLTVKAPDVSQSRIRWTGRDDRLYVGLLSVKGLGQKTMARIIEERNRKPYTDLEDFLDRVRPDESETRALIHCGGLDGLSPDGKRGELLWRLAMWHKTMASRRQNPNLFDDPPPAGRLALDLPPDDPRERLRREFAVLGFLCDFHPMALFVDTLKKTGTIKAARLSRFIGKSVTLAGFLITSKLVSTKHDEPMEFLTFEDETGTVEATFFPDTYRRFSHMIDHGRPYLLRGRVEENWGAVTLTVHRVASLGRP
jgi:DNA polymerase-3 subunit alpha/error-prone DNA polymerase